MQVKLTIQQSLKDGSIIYMPFTVTINKHNRAVAMGTICNEVCEGLRLLAKWKSNGRVRANVPCEVSLQVADLSISTDGNHFRNVEMIRELRTKLKISAGNPQSEKNFFGALFDIFNYMTRKVVFMTLEEFFMKKGFEASEQKREKETAREQQGHEAAKAVLYLN